MQHMLCRVYLLRRLVCGWVLFPTQALACLTCGWVHCRFLVKPDRGAGGRNTDSKDAALILFRSIAGAGLLSHLLCDVTRLRMHCTFADAKCRNSDLDLNDISAKEESVCHTGSVRYLYPFQTPISDFGAQRKRIEAIRQTLGWRKVGCELKECFE